MEDDIFFNKFVTKDLHPIGGDQRFFEGYLTVLKQFTKVRRETSTQQLKLQEKYTKTIIWMMRSGVKFKAESTKDCHLVEQPRQTELQRS